MEQIYDSLKNLISRDMISKASRLFEEKDSTVSKAASSIIASFLGILLKNGKTPQIRNIFEEAGKLDVLSQMDNVWEENPTQDQQRIGDDFLQHLLGDKAADFTDPIASTSGISKVATNRLVSMIAPVVTGYFGNKMVKENWSLHHLLEEIGNQRDTFKGFIPAGLINSFNLNSVLSGDNPYAKRATEKPRNKYGWLIWVVLLALLILLFFWWRSCRDTRTTDTIESRGMVTDTISQGTNRNNDMATTTTVRDTTSTELILSNGTRLRAYRGGIEDEMIKFLNSDDYKNATENDLKDKWFQFDNITFEFGSSTELTQGSRTQLNNIIQILKNYPDAKVKIGGFADKKGTEEANMAVSKERAKTIESLLDKGGVGRQVVRTEGYGDEYATRSASASDDARAEDRDIALRFVK